MTRLLLIQAFAVLLIITLVLPGLGTAASASADDRTAEDILKDIAEVKMPAYDRNRSEEDGYLEEYYAQTDKVNQLKADLYLELYQTHPEHEQAITLLKQRWILLYSRIGECKLTIQETNEFLATQPDEPLAADVRYIRFSAYKNAALFLPDETEKKAYRQKTITLGDEFIKMYPEDKRSPRILYDIAYYVIRDDNTKKRAYYQRIIDKYPDENLVKYVPGKIKQIDNLGKLFDLEFSDALTGSKISMNKLTGKVVVIDFWATWCGPCIAEIPRMKELYTKYRDQGVEFIGISLDQPEDKGGLKALLDYCKENELVWPQYYQGNAWQGDFSLSWGINSIPSMFIIDRKGNLYSTNARGKLDTLIPELLGVATNNDGG